MNARRRMAWALGGLLLGSLSGRAVVAAPQPLQLTDLAKIVKLSAATISPDGKWIAVIVATPDWKTDKPLQETQTPNPKPQTPNPKPQTPWHKVESLH